MRSGKESPRASAALESLYSVYQSYSPPPADGLEAGFYDQAVRKLSEAARPGPAGPPGHQRGIAPSMLLLALPVGGLLLLVLEYRPKLPLRPQLVYMGLLATVLSFCYVLTIVMDYPFSGDISVGTDNYKVDALSQFWASEKPHKLAPGETKLDLTPDELAGVWHSATFGTVVIRRAGDEFRAVYRHGSGTVVGRISPDGVFRGWWCDAPTRQPADDAGDVEWTLVKTRDSRISYGSLAVRRHRRLQGRLGPAEDRRPATARPGVPVRGFLTVLPPALTRPPRVGPRWPPNGSNLSGASGCATIPAQISGGPPGPPGGWRVPMVMISGTDQRKGVGVGGDLYRGTANASKEAVEGIVGLVPGPGR